MPLAKGRTERVELPGDEWVEIRRPSIAHVLEAQRIEAAGGTAMLTLLERCITAWSYPEQVTPDNVAELEPSAAIAVSDRLRAAMDGESAADQKNG